MKIGRGSEVGVGSGRVWDVIRKFSVVSGKTPPPLRPRRLTSEVNLEVGPKSETAPVPPEHED